MKSNSKNEYIKTLRSYAMQGEARGGRNLYSDKLFEIANYLESLQNQPQADKWIPCEVEMPKEHDSMFSKLKGTDKWSDAMFEKISDDVNVTIELEDGSRITKTAHTIDGKWSVEINSWIKQKVIAWQPLPQPYKKEGAE